MILAIMALVGVLLNIGLIGLNRAASEVPFQVLLGISVVGYGILLGVGALGVGASCTCSRAWLPRFAAVYVGNQVFVFIMIIVFVRMIGGASMAAVEGLVPVEELRRTSIQASLPLLVIAQLVILPWTLISVRIVRRMGLDSSPGENEAEGA